MKKVELLNAQGGVVSETRGVYGKVLKFLNYNPNKRFLNSIAEFIIQTTESITGVGFVDNRVLRFNDFHYMIMESYLGMRRSSVDSLNDDQKQRHFVQAYELHHESTQASYSFSEISALLEYQLLALYKKRPRNTTPTEHKARIITSIIVYHVRRIVEGFRDSLVESAVNWKHRQSNATRHLEYPILGFFHKYSLWHFDLETMLSMPTEMLSLYFRNTTIQDVQELMGSLSPDTATMEVILFKETLIDFRYMLKKQIDKNSEDKVLHWIYHTITAAIIVLESKHLDAADKSYLVHSDKRAFSHLMRSEVLKSFYKRHVPWYRRITHQSRMRNMRQLLTAYLFEPIITAQPYHIEEIPIPWNAYFHDIYKDTDQKPFIFPSDSLSQGRIELELESGKKNKELTGLNENEKEKFKGNFDKAVKKLESLKKTIASYQVDFVKAIHYPAFNDITVPEVTAMHKQLSKTENLLMKVSNSQSEKLLHEFIESVDMLAIDIRVAQRRAEVLSYNEYSEEEQKDFILAENLFRQAKNKGNTQKMRQNYYAKLQEVLERLNKSTEVIPYEIVQEIEETARKQLTS